MGKRYNQALPEGLPLWGIPFAEGILPKESLWDFGRDKLTACE